MNKLLILCFGLFLIGCKETVNRDAIDRLTAQAERIDTKLDTIIGSGRNQDTSATRHELFRDIASSKRLSSIVANYMNSLSLMSLKNNDLAFIQTISNELKDDLHDEVMFNAIFNQGYAYSVNQVPNGFIQYDKWFINTNPGEYFSDGDFKYSLKLFFYETLMKPNCEQGKPTIVYKLINKIGNEDDAPAFEILESSNSWTIMPQSEISINKIRDFRVLVEARCQ
ncbi:hypothetical protein [Vibrio cholerae]|uniref:hypothetical protein n=1 Tax=Vibrio cholerae TaxID=666 RepID=UPI0004E3F867|nr:hypothetical protein [Vibrio cholerae]KFE28840.1 putative lipoprotein [Vibrio cholerae]MBY4641951.1 hypothetical protein [Vibrio cholerae]MCR9658223.1 hypothetical protein [Vibrio cholerae]MCR9688904.1 hypothetical protein [Vibrio cholerae]MCR9737412.1 hypothetical protein [Vibrio cholerae]